MASIHGLLANLFVLFLFGGLFFDFIGFFREPRFYPLMALSCFLLSIVTLIPLITLGVIMTHQFGSSGSLPALLAKHISLGSATVFLLIISLVIRLRKGKNPWRIGLYFVIQIVVLAVAAIAAHAGGTFAVQG